MKNNHIRLVVILGIIAIIGVTAMQIYWLQKAYDIKEQQFSETIYTALLDVAKNLSSDNQGSSLSNEDIIQQISSDYFVVNINDVIDANVLEYYLTNEFEKFQIALDFEYAIYDCSSDKMMYGSYVSIEDDKNNTPTTDLPKYDEYIYYFGVFFPTKSTFVISNIRLGLVSSVVMLFAVVFFGFAIYIILQQKRLSELQTDFINNMTHEFKTPISSISLSSDVLLKHPSIKENDRLSNYTKIIKEQVARLSRQVEKVLQMANIQQSQYESIDLIDLTESIVKATNLNADEHKDIVRFSSNVASVWIKADKLHLTNILYSILENAKKYTQEAPDILVQISCEKDEIHVSIKDNGIGIDKKYIKRIFDRFYRIPTGNIHDVKGFGLGLYYVKKVVDQHHWKIHVESEVGKGTQVAITMPVQKIQAKQ